MAFGQTYRGKEADIRYTEGDWRKDIQRKRGRHTKGERQTNRIIEVSLREGFNKKKTFFLWNFP